MKLRDFMPNTTIRNWTIKTFEVRVSFSYPESHYALYAQVSGNREFAIARFPLDDVLVHQEVELP